VVYSRVVAASVVSDEFHYDLSFATDESRADLEPSVAIQLTQQHKDATTGLVCLEFDVVFAPFKIMT